MEGIAMKILLYSDHQKAIEKSGVGRALYHQKMALEKNKVFYTTNKEDKFDIIHINTIFPKSFIMSKLAKSKGKKVVYHAHSTEEDFKNSFIGSNLISPLFKKWLITCYNTGDLIFTPTKYSKQILEGYRLKKPIVNISNGIDLQCFHKNKKGAYNFRRRYNFSPVDKVIMSVGLYIERKGILDFVELAKAMPEYKFIWFGYTNLRTVPKKIREAVKTKLPNLLFPGYVSREELRDAYSGSDLFLFLTHEETEGIVLLEALAMKTPVLIRDIPIYNTLKNGENVYKAENLPQFQEKIKAVVDGDLPLLVDNGYKIAKERDIKCIGEQMVSEYSKLLLSSASS